MFNIIEILLNPQFSRALYAVLLISLITATLGTFTVFKETTFTVSTLAHGAWMGAALGILIQARLYHWLDSLYTTIIVVVLLSLLLSILSKRNTVSGGDVAIGVVFGLTMSLAVLFSSMLRELTSRVLGIIFGDILFLSIEDLAILSTITLITVFVIVVFFERFLYISFDPEGSAAMGLKVELYEITMLILTALAVVVLVKTVGAILVYAMLIIPPATAKEISKNPYEVTTKSFIYSITAGTTGLFLSVIINVAPSAIMGLISVSIYATIRLRSRTR